MAAARSDVAPEPNSSLSARLKTLAEIREFWPCLRPYRLKFGAGVVFGLLAGLLGLALPYFIGIIVDGMSGGTMTASGPPRLLDSRHAAPMLFLALGAQAVCIFLHISWVVEGGERAVAALRGAAFERMARQPMAFFARNRVGELTTRLTGDLAEVRSLLVLAFPVLVRQTFVLMGATVLLVTASPRLAALMLAAFPVLGVIVLLAGRAIRRNQSLEQNILAEVGGVAEEALQGIATVKAFHQERREIERYREAQARLLKRVSAGARLRAGLVAFAILGLSAVIVAVIWRGVALVDAGELTAGELTRFVLYTGFMGGAIGLLGDRLGVLQRTLGATQWLRELLREPIEQVGSELLPTASSSSGRLRGEIEFRHVGFAYPSRAEVAVLRNFSLSIRPGETLALAGASGAGKSTLVALLLRFFEPDSGALLIDGRDARSYSLAELRSHIGVVPQDVVLFSGTIAENIAYGKPEATSEEIVEAARQAHAQEFVSTLPKGYSTLVGERGMQLSGGQRQRIAIARCILRNPAILILDEATSALDPESERLLQAAMRAVVAGRTTLIIAHRPSTVRIANRIAVLKDGGLAELGTHEELMLREQGLYRNLSALQLAAGDSE